MSSATNYTDLSASIARAVSTPIARRDRVLFQELNPELETSPITHLMPDDYRPAAVLVPIMLRAHGPSVLFTVRTQTMPTHPGQIAFPGGGPKSGDTSLVETALRETQEEVGIPNDAIEVVGQFGKHYGGRGFAVTPVLGLVSDGVEINPCPNEVDSIFEVPLHEILKRERHIVEPREFGGMAYNMFAFPYPDVEPNRHIWGLTAGIVDTLSLAVGDAMGG